MKFSRTHGYQLLKISEVCGIVITIALLPIDRFPYLHKTPLRLGLVSALLLLVAALIRLGLVAYHKRNSDLKRYLLVGLILGLPVLGYVLSSIKAIDQSFALGATTILATVALRAFCFFVIISEVPKYWGLIRNTLYVVTAAIVAFGLFQFIADVWGAFPSITDLRNCCTSNSTYVFPRVHSTALEPLYFDHFLIIPLWLLIFDFLRSKKYRQDKRLVILFIITIELFILTVARSAIFAFIVTSVIFYLAIRKQKGVRNFSIFMGKLLGSAAAIAIILVIMSGVASLFINKTAQYGSQSGAGSLELFGGHLVDVNDGSAQTRYSLWPKAISYIKESPLYGVGADNSRIKLNLAKYRKGTPITELQPFNNDLIGLLVDLGILAILSFGLLVGVLIQTITKFYKNMWQNKASPFALALIAMVIQGNFFQSLLLTRLWIVIGIVLAGSIATKAKNLFEDNNLK